MNRTQAARAIEQAARGMSIRAACAAPVDCLTLIDGAGMDFAEQDARDALRMMTDKEYYRARGGWAQHDADRQAEKIGAILDNLTARGLTVQTVEAWEQGAGDCVICLSVTKRGARALADYYE